MTRADDSNKRRQEQTTTGANGSSKQRREQMARAAGSRRPDRGAQRQHLWRCSNCGRSKVERQCRSHRSKNTAVVYPNPATGVPRSGVDVHFTPTNKMAKISGGVTSCIRQGDCSVCRSGQPIYGKCYPRLNLSCATTKKVVCSLSRICLCS
jgi:hypothetical protein